MATYNILASEGAFESAWIAFDRSRKRLWNAANDSSIQKSPISRFLLARTFCVSKDGRLKKCH
jgi:hypothetical protein